MKNKTVRFDGWNVEQSIQTKEAAFDMRSKSKASVSTLAVNATKLSQKNGRSVGLLLVDGWPPQPDVGRTSTGPTPSLQLPLSGTMLHGIGVEARSRITVKSEAEAESLRVALFVRQISFVTVNHDGATACNLFTPGFGSVDSREIASEKNRLMVGKQAAANNRTLVNMSTHNASDNAEKNIDF
ncbi:hypothetical protein CEXT_509001 [Caerostris extrusa]|uniref:Uncharacterized protein n=1 Tax=Caerostris extrusa TaxID=172846 RepID=A0AAV4QT31_CAEEX|nr:hypothetical protein CEXT_509001 [Caerostris extrusa]